MHRRLIKNLCIFLLLLDAVLLAGWPALVQAKEYGDITFERKAKGMDDIPPSIFQHWVHRMQYKCVDCHDKLFKMKAGEDLVNMGEMTSGLWCGACHNGKDAFETDNFDSCPLCHYK